jgi:dephospho-CoA kinase
MKSKPSSFIVGIGGQAGSGKSTMARYFARRGAEIIDADKIGWTLLMRSAPTCAKVVRSFGLDILNSKGNIDRRTLGRMVFSSRAAMARLNRIVHPALLKELQRRIQTPGKPVKVVDAALLFTWKWHKKVDLSILVTAPTKVKITRMIKTGVNETQAEDRLRSQMSEGQMKKLASLVVENSGSVTDLRQQCRKLWDLIQEKRARK